MVKLARWQWAVLVAPVALTAGFVLAAAGWQIQRWGISWIWAVVVLGLVAWRWLLALWTRPVEIGESGLSNGMVNGAAAQTGNESAAVAAAVAAAIAESQADPPLWEDWERFWRRCQNLVSAIAQIYYPEAKYPLLNIYVPQAYGLIRGTVDDVDRWMQQLSPVLGQVTVGQAYQGYRLYQKLEPSARQIRRLWGWARWITNPAAAVAKQASQPYSQRANQALLGNLSQMLREVALRNLAQQTASLYGGQSSPAPILEATPSAASSQQTATLSQILAQAQPIDQVERAPLNIWIVGRTGAGKSSVINSLFQVDRAEVDLLPNTDDVRSYQWQTDAGERLQLWDTPGYEQVNRSYEVGAQDPGILLLVTPATDPALQMDADQLGDLLASGQGDDAEDRLPAIAILTQVDRLRPVREWSPPYDWEHGDRPKEQSIRGAIAYRAQQLPQCRYVVPLVTRGEQRPAWNIDALSEVLLSVVGPAKRLRLARALRSRQSQAAAAAQIIQRLSDRMTTTQGIAALLKSPILGYLTTLSTGSPALAHLLAQQIPVEQLPLVMGKLQMAYELFSLLGQGDQQFELLTLWPLMTDSSASPRANAWAVGQALVEYWTSDAPIDLRSRFQHYLAEAEAQ
ncbi:MAG: GTPase [Elainellaceae cyanobacterium]